MNPIRHMLAIISGTNCHRLWLALLASQTCSALTAINRSRAVCDTRRAPNRSTIRALVKLATAIDAAQAAKISGKFSPAPKCSATSCCAELMNPNSPPVTIAAPIT